MLPDDITECSVCGKTIRYNEVCCDPMPEPTDRAVGELSDEELLDRYVTNMYSMVYGKNASLERQKLRADRGAHRAELLRRLNAATADRGVIEYDKGYHAFKQFVREQIPDWEPGDWQIIAEAVWAAIDAALSAASDGEPTDE